MTAIERCNAQTGSARSCTVRSQVRLSFAYNETTSEKRFDCASDRCPASIKFTLLAAAQQNCWLTTPARPARHTAADLTVVTARQRHSPRTHRSVERVNQTSGATLTSPASERYCARSIDPSECFARPCRSVLFLVRPSCVAAMSSPSAVLDAELRECMHSIRSQLSARGQHSFRQLCRAFAVNDPQRSGRVDVDTLEAVLAKVGVFLRRQQLTKLFRYVDRDGRGSLLVADFLQAVQGELSERRFAIIQAAFAQLDSQRAGSVPLAAILRSFDAVGHPSVLSGSRSEQQVRADLAAALEGAGGSSGGSVSAAEWADYYAGISCVTPQDDDYFCAMMERCWHVREARGRDDRQALLNRVRHILRERTAQRDSGMRTESEKLRVMLKWWDLEGSGLVSFPQFHGALQRFGLVLDDQTTHALFDLFDSGSSGHINYNEFVAVLYEDDIVSTYWTDKQLRDRAQLAGEQKEQQREYVDTNTVLLATSTSRAKQQPPVQLSADSKPAAAAVRSSAAARPTALFVLGGPGSGKGTQCARIVKEFGFVHLSTGDLLRAETSAAEGGRSETGALIAACIAEGRLVPVQLIVSLLDSAIQAAVARGQRYFLVDGFPRAVDQKAAWDAVLGARDISVPFILFFDCPLAVLEQRLLRRGQSSGRADDNIDAIKKRFVTFDTESRPVVQQFAEEGRVRLIDGTQTPDAVYSQVRQLVASIVH